MAVEPRPLQLIIFAVVSAAVTLSGAGLIASDGNLRAWSIAGLLTVIAIAFEEGARHAIRLQIRLRTQLRADMTSVWIVTAGVALAPGRAALLLAILYTYVWFRQNRPAGELLHRKVYNASSNILAALAAGAAARAIEPAVSGMSLGLSGALPIFVGVLVAIAVSRLLITIALMSIGVHGRDLLGTVHDNLIELATPCLGGLVALAVQHEPLLALLVLAPMVTLQRGAVVRELEAAAITDAKTGLLNAVAWEQLAQRELTRAGRAGGPLAVMIIDIDRFKAVNDRYGHLVGDKVLAGVARSIKESLRGYDGPGRFGGEEFVAVLPDAGEHDALVVAERVRLKVNELTVAGIVGDESTADETPSPRLSVSIGVAVLPASDVELTDLLHAADQALYRAKWSGRNQVRLARRGDEVSEIAKV